MVDIHSEENRSEAKTVNCRQERSTAPVGNKCAVDFQLWARVRSASRSESFSAVELLIR